MNTDRKNLEFVHHFDTRDIFQDRMVTMATGVYSLDIIKLDAWMKKNHGYRDEQGSLKDFIFNTFGKNAHNFIVELLQAPGRG